MTSSTNSFLFLNAGYSTLSFHSLSAQLNGWIGQSYMAGDANLALRMHTYPICIKPACSSFTAEIL